MRIFVTDHFHFPLPSGHRFPVEKYVRLRERVQTAPELAGATLLVPAAATRAQLLRAHSEAYLDHLERGDLTRAEARELGLPWSPQLLERSLRSVGGTIEACRAALSDGVAVTLAGGTHHAFRDKGEGFCVFNDVVVAAREMLASAAVKRVVVIDLDVHQGNGTAALCADDPLIYTFSMHCQSNYPLHKEVSDFDVALPNHTEDAAYLAALDDALPRVLAAARADLAIYVAGADPWCDDRLGRLSLTKDGLRARDRRVFSALHSRAIPVAVTMSGGYARNIEDTVDIQLATVIEAAQLTVKG